MKTTHVIIINDFGHVNGGAGKVALSSAAALSRQGYDVTLLCAVAPVDTEMLRGVKVVCLEQFDILNDPSRRRAVCQGLWNRKAYRELSRLLDLYPVESTVVHFHSWTKSLSASLFKATAEHGSRVLITLHDFFAICPNGGLFNYQQAKICRLRPSSLRCLCCHCDVRSYPQKVWRSLRHLLQSYYLRRNKNLSVCTISRLNEQLIRPHLSVARRWFFLQNPIELNTKPMVDVAHNDKYLFMARLSKEKGCQLFCRAITRLGLKGMVMGDGYLRGELEAQYPDIEFVGWATGERKEHFLRQCKALVFTSLWYEGAPLTIVEMKSYGIPCIVPDECAAAEQIADGQTGFIFRTGDIDSLCEAIGRFEHTDVAAMQRHIVETFHPEEFNMQTHVHRLLDIYSQLTDDPHRSSSPCQNI